jgi:hypothetical protein
VAFKLAAEVREQDELRARSERRRLEELLDRVWEIHTGPVFQATMELWVAARTDPELRAEMDEVQRDVTRMVARVAAELFPELMGKQHAGDVLDLGMATMRGLAVLGFTSDQADVERRWRRARAYLLGLYERD